MKNSRHQIFSPNCSDADAITIANVFAGNISNDEEVALMKKMFFDLAHRKVDRSDFPADLEEVLAAFTTKPVE